eukprot:931787-Pleurochrysis_carterae.AAC.1
MADLTRQTPSPILTPDFRGYYSHNTPVPAKVIARYPHLITTQALAAAAGGGFYSVAPSGPQCSGTQSANQRSAILQQARVRRALCEQLKAEVPPLLPPLPPACEDPAGWSAYSLSVALNVLLVAVLALCVAPLSLDSGANAVLVRMCSGAVANFALEVCLNVFAYAVVGAVSTCLVDLMRPADKTLTQLAHAPPARAPQAHLERGPFNDATPFACALNATNLTLCRRAARRRSIRIPTFQPHTRIRLRLPGGRGSFHRVKSG